MNTGDPSAAHGHNGDGIGNGWHPALTQKPDGNGFGHGRRVGVTGTRWAVPRQEQTFLAATSESFDASLINALIRMNAP